jgi:spore coat polysaccharide biosynthesis protein SpsF
VQVAILVQARMNSARLPGKVLREVRGQPLLAYLTERLAACRDAPTIVVTSTSDRDDAVAAFCVAAGLLCHRGPEADVSTRFAEAGERFELDAFCRVSGDSPLLDPALVDRALTLFRRDEYDLVTNVRPRTFPPGQSIEVVRAEAFLQALPTMDAEQREHVTQRLYDPALGLRIANFAADRDYGDLRLAVDTEEDLERIEALIAAMERPAREYGLDALADLAGVAA